MKKYKTLHTMTRVRLTQLGLLCTHNNKRTHNTKDIGIYKRDKIENFRKL